MIFAIKAIEKNEIIDTDNIEQIMLEKDILALGTKVKQKYLSLYNHNGVFWMSKTYYINNFKFFWIVERRIKPKSISKDYNNVGFDF